LTPQLTYYRVKKEEKLNNRFLYYYFQSPEFLVSLNHIAGAGSTRAYIGITRQLDLSISFPNVEYQQRLASKLDELVVESRQIEGIYKQKLIALAELKESLLQKAFSGQLAADRTASNPRLKDEEVA
jgi:type I restriction enzyme S subunit